MNIPRAAAAVTLAGVAGTAVAQSSVTIYGDIDEYGNYMKSSSGTHVVAIEDGAFLRSRLGFKGQEDIGDGYLVKFNARDRLQHGLRRLRRGNTIFDRQAWVGLAAPSVGEFRSGARTARSSCAEATSTTPRARSAR